MYIRNYFEPSQKTVGEVAAAVAVAANTKDFTRHELDTVAEGSSQRCRIWRQENP